MKLDANQTIGEYHLFHANYITKDIGKETRNQDRGNCQRMTVNAGLVPVLRFMNAIRLDRIIADMVSTPDRDANAEYSFSDLIQLTICGQIADTTVLEHVFRICSDEIVSRCVGWDKVPHPSYFAFSGLALIPLPPVFSGSPV